MTGTGLMKGNVGAMLICGLLTATSASCGFKSDLYLPGQQQKIEQYDSRSLKELGDEKLRQLQNEELDSAVVSDVDRNEAPADTMLVIPDDGVVVDLPTADEIAREKERLRESAGE